MPSKNNMRPVHPGEVLLEEFLKPLDLSANKLAGVLNVPTNRITEIVAEQRGVTADTALRLATVLGTSPEFWMNLQQTYELRTTAKDIATELRAMKPLQKTA